MRPARSMESSGGSALERAFALAGGAPGLARAAGEARMEPERMARLLERGLRGPAERVCVTGALESRVVVIDLGDGEAVVASLGGQAVRDLPWPEPVRRGLWFESAGGCVSRAALGPDAARRLFSPHVKLVALYHPEFFPVPRFALGISDIARAIRAGLQGRVTLADMQLGWSLEDVLAEIDRERPEVLGVSATFGQHDLLVRLVEGVAALGGPGPLLVLGGSLPALNAEYLLERFPSALVARGAGEDTMRDVVSHALGDLPLDEVQGILFRRDGRVERSSRALNRHRPDFLPELDLLEATLARGGVMQLEASRGCTHACSFCPREHKGAWVGGDPRRLDELLDAVRETYRRYPHLSRKVFLVDEEFIGYRRDGGAVDRAREVAGRLHERGFRWETSARVDQVYRPDRDRDWHLDRMRFWTRLRQQGLDRCLFGVESGVDSILRRFNKQSTADQNARAVRILSACGVPIRCTYITFDPLMTMEELVESHRFQGRRDLLLRPVPDLPFDQLFDAVHDDGWCREHAAGRPLYSQISYMLVSMECLIGSPYLRLVEEAGLARDHCPAMGRRDAEYRDPAIGVMSDCSQRWIDRSFAFDYTLKGLEKVAAGAERDRVRELRARLKDSAHHLLGEMLGLAAGGLLPSDRGRAARQVLDLMERRFPELVRSVEAAFDRGAADLHPDRRSLLAEHLARWRAQHSWELINA